MPDGRVAAAGSAALDRGVGDLAEFVKGIGDASRAGPLVQQVVGALFSPDYRSSPRTWSAAVTLARAAGSANPFLHVWLRVTRRLQRARHILAAPVSSDLAAVNATGIALHHIVEGVHTMRDLYADPTRRKVDLKTAALSLWVPESRSGVMRRSRTQAAKGRSKVGADAGDD